MDELFSITVTYKGADYTFDTHLVTAGYTHKFIVTIENLEVIYEPDEERRYRALLADVHMQPTEKQAALISAVAEKIETAL